MTADADGSVPLCHRGQEHGVDAGFALHGEQAGTAIRQDNLLLQPIYSEGGPLHGDLHTFLDLRGEVRYGYFGRCHLDAKGQHAEVATVNVTQGAAYGAALLAGVGAGVFPDVRTAAKTVVRETGSTRPGADRDVYAPIHERYRRLYPALRNEFRA